MIDTEKIKLYSHNMPLWRAQYLIKESAYWIDHPKGPVKAPKHAENIERGPYGWQIAFGANKFLIEKTTMQCCNAILEWHSKGSSDVKDLRRNLGLSMQGAVSNWEDELYEPYYTGIDDSGMLHFGAQGILISEFIEALLKSVGVA